MFTHAETKRNPFHQRIDEKNPGRQSKPPNDGNCRRHDSKLEFYREPGRSPYGNRNSIEAQIVHGFADDLTHLESAGDGSVPPVSTAFPADVLNPLCDREISHPLRLPAGDAHAAPDSLR